MTDSLAGGLSRPNEADMAMSRRAHQRGAPSMIIPYGLAVYLPKHASSYFAFLGISSWTLRKVDSSHHPSTREASHSGKDTPRGTVRWFRTKWMYLVSPPLGEESDLSAATGLGARMISMSRRAPKGTMCLIVILCGPGCAVGWSWSANWVKPKAVSTETMFVS